MVGNQIRWFDLRMVKNDWEEQKDYSANRSSLSQQQDQSQHPTYRVRKNDHVQSLTITDLRRFFLHQSINRYASWSSLLLAISLLS